MGPTEGLREEEEGEEMLPSNGPLSLPRHLWLPRALHSPTPHHHHLDVTATHTSMWTQPHGLTHSVPQGIVEGETPEF